MKFIKGFFKFVFKLIGIVLLIALGVAIVMTVLNLREFGVLPEGIAQIYDVIYGWIQSALSWLFGLVKPAIETVEEIVESVA